jgi:hypothetical protein
MPGKYKATVGITLSTTVEPDGYLTGVEDEVLDYDFSGSWGYGEDVRVDGAEVYFVIEADSEDEARGRVQEIMDGASWGGDSLEWEIEDWEIESVEETVPPMDAERAKALISAFLDYEVQSGRIDAETREAFEFVLELLTP